MSLLKIENGVVKSASIGYREPEKELKERAEKRKAIYEN